MSARRGAFGRTAVAAKGAGACHCHCAPAIHMHSRRQARSQGVGGCPNFYGFYILSHS